MQVILNYEVVMEDVDSIEEAVEQAVEVMKDPSVVATFSFISEDHPSIGGGIVNFLPNGEVKITASYPPD